MELTGKQLIICMDDETDSDITVREVLRLIENGFTSGSCPTFYFKQENETNEIKLSKIQSDVLSGYLGSKNLDNEEYKVVLKNILELCKKAKW